MLKYKTLLKRMEKDSYSNLFNFFDKINLEENIDLAKKLMNEFFDKSKIKPRWKRKIKRGLCKIISKKTDYERLDEININKYFLFVDLLNDINVIPLKQGSRIRELKSQLDGVRIKARDALYYDFKTHKTAIIVWNDFLGQVKKNLIGMINHYVPQTRTY